MISTPYLLKNETFAVAQPRIIDRYGANAAIVLEAIHTLQHSKSAVTRNGKNYARVSVDWIVKNRGIKEWTVWRVLRKLENLGFIIRQRIDKWKWHQINFYQICWDKVTEVFCSKNKHECSETLGKPDSSILQESILANCNNQNEHKDVLQKEERNGASLEEPGSFFLSSFKTDKLQEQPIQLPVVSISEIGAKVTDDFTNKQTAILQISIAGATEAITPHPQEASKAAALNTSVTDFGIQYMAHSWNMVAKELEIDNALKNIDSLSQKTLDHAKLTWDKFGRDGWEKVLEMYQLSAYLQGKTDANGHTAFTFASIVDPARAEVISSGKYTGGITVAKRDGEEHVTTLAELNFEGGFSEEKRILADRITAACYRSWIVDPGVQFRVVGNTLYLDCTPFTFDKLEIRFKDVLLEVFGCGRLERGS